MLFADFPDPLGGALDDKKPNLEPVTMSPKLNPKNYPNILPENWQISNIVSDNLNS